MSANELQSDILAFEQYLRAERGMADNSVQAYRRDLAKYADWVSVRRLENYLKPSLRDLSSYLVYLNDQQLAPPSVARHIVSLRMFYRFLRLEERAEQTAVDLLGSPKLWQRIPAVLNPANVEKLLKSPQAGDRFFVRDRAILETLYATGCRVSEVVNLRVVNVYLDSAFLRCTGKGNKERVVPLGRPAIAALRAYLGEDRPQTGSDRVFLSRSGRPLCRIRIWRLVKFYCARAGLPTNVSPHTLRHSFASHVLAGGADLRSVQELLGHASIATTQHYTHIDRDRLKAIHKKFHPRG